jgi:hypothetical protein
MKGRPLQRRCVAKKRNASVHPDERIFVSESGKVNGESPQTALEGTIRNFSVIDKILKVIASGSDNEQGTPSVASGLILLRWP